MIGCYSLRIQKLIYDHCVIMLVLGDDSGKIIIWNMAPVREEAAEKNSDVPKILCEMDNHLGNFKLLMIL